MFIELWMILQKLLRYFFLLLCMPRAPQSTVLLNHRVSSERTPLIMWFIGRQMLFLNSVICPTSLGKLVCAVKKINTEIFQIDQILIFKFECSILEHCFCVEMVLWFLINVRRSLEHSLLRALPIAEFAKWKEKSLTLKQKKSLSGDIFRWLNTSSMGSVYIEAKK